MMVKPRFVEPVYIGISSSARYGMVPRYRAIRTVSVIHRKRKHHTKVIGLQKIKRRISCENITGRYRSISTVAAHYRAVSAWLRRGKKHEKEGEPQTVLPFNSEVVARLSETSAGGEPQDGTTDEENLTRRRLLRRSLLLV
ncbi:hypothetical protein BHM03_00049968 [Ensete ventricosum]|nr:hypothetical protein BHM03_00049968 [Ensete ventricosum]